MKNIQSLPQLRKETYADSDTEDRTYAEKLEESNTKSIQKKKRETKLLILLKKPFLKSIARNGVGNTRRKYRLS